MRRIKLNTLHGIYVFNMPLHAYKRRVVEMTSETIDIFLVPVTCFPFMRTH